MGRVQRTNVGKIIFPLKVSEADIGYKIKARLDAHGLTCRQQVQAYCEFRGRIRKNYMDVVAFMGQRPVAIVEVKSGGLRFSKPNESTIQVQKYRTFGLPIFFCRGAGMVDEVVQQIIDLENWVVEGPKGG